MVLVQRYCPRCGAACPSTDAVCAACGSSFKVTLPLNEDLNILSSSLKLTHHLHANDLFKGRYRILRQVGVGGFGAVYEAEDTREKRRVAIKEIGLAGLTSQQMIEATGSFHREAELLSSLKHPSIPHIYERLTDTEHWYLVMDFIEGETLEHRLEKAAGGRVPLAQTLQIGIQICNVLEYLHNRQPAVIFRDIKPANIMLTPDHRLHVIDFGVARLYKSGQPKDTIAFGSPGYAAPEQYGRAQTTQRSDIYSLGAMLHQMLTGRDPSLNPFRFQPLSASDRTLPIKLEKLIAQMLETDMQQRPASVDEVRRRLQSIAASRIVTRRHKAGPSRGAVRSQPPLASAAALARAFSTIGVTVAIYRGHAAAVNALAWSPDARAIASCADDRVIAVWDAFQPTVSHVLPLSVRPANELAWAPDGQVLATAGDDRTVLLWRLNAQPRWWQKLGFSLGFRISTYRGHTTPVNALSWSPDGHMIVSAEEKSAIQVWDARLRKQVLLYQRHSNVVEDVAWSPDGLRIASSSLDHSVRVWDADHGKDLWRWRAKGGSIVHTLAWSPDARYLACGASNGSVHIWDILHQSQVYIYQSHKDGVSSVAWSPDGQRIASASFDGTVHLWSALDGKEAFVYRGHEDSVLTVVWSPDGQHLASAGRDDLVHVWKTV